MFDLIASIDHIANILESKGLLKEAYDLDVLANTLDLMTAPAKVTERERNEEFNYVVLNAKNNPPGTKQGLSSYWGPQWGKALFEIANRQALAGKTMDMFPQWQKATVQAKQDKSRQVSVQPQDDPFMSPEERARVRTTAKPQEYSPFVE